jgi:hypothetical protein
MRLTCCNSAGWRPIAGVGRRNDTILASLECSLCRLVRRDIKCHLGGSAGGPLSNAGLFDLYPKLLILLVRKRESKNLRNQLKLRIRK